MKKYDAVFFDFDETLVHADPPVFDTFLPACEKLGLSFDEDQVKSGHRFLYEYFAGETAMKDYERLKRDMSKFHNELTARTLNLMGVDESAATQAVNDGQLTVRLPEGHRCGTDSHQVLETLKDRGYKLGVISNNHRDIEAFCKHQGFSHHLDTVVTRVDAGCSKPDPRIFQMALDHVGVKPENSVYVGDNYFADALGSKQMGMKAVLLDHYDVFPDADCDVISELNHLLEII
jgi:HAD superfamily hydrolase (TIGR01662 family)